MKILKERGDTIVEVMICIAILGFVIAASYTLSNRNTIATRKAQERSEAMRIAESQMEMLRAYFQVHNGTANLKDSANALATHFCFNQATTQAQVVTERSGAIPTILEGSTNTPKSDINLDTATNYQACSRGFYRYSVWTPTAAEAIGGKNPTSAGGENAPYAVTVRWETAGGGGGQDEVKLFYTILPDQNP